MTAIPQPCFEEVSCNSSDSPSREVNNCNVSERHISVHFCVTCERSVHYRESSVTCMKCYTLFLRAMNIPGGSMDFVPRLYGPLTGNVPVQKMMF